MKVEFYKHNIGRADIKRMERVLGALFLTTGDEVAEFESKFSGYLGCKHTVGVTSCTAALHLSLLALGIGPGDEVITTAMTFIATANSILHAGAKPVFVDVEADTGNIDAAQIEKAITRRTKAILVVHLYGTMCNIRSIKKIADKYGLKVIEDCAHCIEGERDNIRPVQVSDAACFSFYATKSITCGEGGAVSTNNSVLADRIRRLRLHGMTKDAQERYRLGKFQHWDMIELGWKYNMDNIKAALLIGQINHIDAHWLRRFQIYRQYKQKFNNLKAITMPKVIGKSALHLLTVWVNPARRDNILFNLQKKGVGVAVNYRAIHNLSFYKSHFNFRSSDFPVADRIGKRTISLPFYARLKQGEIEYVVKTVSEVI